MGFCDPFLYSTRGQTSVPCFATGFRHALPRCPAAVPCRRALPPLCPADAWPMPPAAIRGHMQLWVEGARRAAAARAACSAQPQAGGGCAAAAAAFPAASAGRGVCMRARGAVCALPCVGCEHMLTLVRACSRAGVCVRAWTYAVMCDGMQGPGGRIRRMNSWLLGGLLGRGHCSLQQRPVTICCNDR